MKKLIIFSLIILLLSLAGIANAATRYVRQTGSNTTTCTNSASPCLTIHYAITQAVASDIIEIMDSGVYSESWEGGAVAPAGSSSSNYTIIRGAAGQRPIIRPPGGACFIFLFAGSVNHYIEVNNLKLDGVNLNNCGALVKITDGSPGDGAHHIRLNNVQITAVGNAFETMPMDNANSHHMGVLGGGTGVEVLNTEIDHVVYCIYWGGDNMIVDHVNCHDVTAYGFHFYTDAAGAAHDNIVRYSLVENFGKYMSTGFHCVAGLLFSKGANNLAHDNIIRGPTGASGSPPNDCGSGFQIEYGASNSQIYNNTVYATQNGLYLGATGGTATIRNNIFYGSTRTSDLYNDGGGNMTQDHNLCATVTGTATCSQTGNPQFNGAPNNLTLASTSPARNNGIDNSAYPVDYAGTPRSSPWDIGAYEYVAPIVCPAVSPALVARYDFEGNGTDSTGNGRTATLGTGWTYTTGHTGQGALSNGTSGITVADHDSLDPCAAFTYEGWVNLANTSGNYAFINKNPDSKAFLFASIYGYCGSGVPIGGYVDITNAVACSTTALTPGFKHLAVTYDSTLASANVKLYLNGAQVASADGTNLLSATTGTLQFCTSSFGETCPSGTVIDDVRIYNYARSASEILSSITAPPVFTIKLDVSSLKIGPSVSLKVGLP